MDMDAAVSVVIPCTRPAAVRRCLEGFARQSGNIPFEVIVVGEAAGLRADGDRFALSAIPCEATHANVRRNLGIRAARAPRVAFMDDDAVPEPGWIEAAARLDPSACTILTGPERPPRSAQERGLAFAVLQNWWGAGSRAHRRTGPGRVGWHEVPFCNCVMPAALFGRVGLPATDIPWEIDDFEFCFRARRRVRFEHVPALAIRHDRYHDSVAALLADTWRRRVRTGELLAARPGLYGRIPAVAVCAALPWVMGISLALRPALGAALALAAACGYLVILMSQSGQAYRYGELRAILPYLGTLAALHGVTLAGLQLGIWRGLTRALWRCWPTVVLRRPRAIQPQSRNSDAGRALWRCWPTVVLRRPRAIQPQSRNSDAGGRLRPQRIVAGRDENTPADVESARHTGVEGG